MLYDAKTETILYDRFLWKNPVATNEATITRTETETYVEETLKDRTDHISLGASIEFTLMKFLEVSIKIRHNLIKWRFFNLKACDQKK